MNAPPAPALAASLDRALRKLPPERLLELSDVIRRAAYAFDRGRADIAIDVLADAVELISSHPQRRF